MSALAMILTAAMVVAGDVPEKVSGDMRQVQALSQISTTIDGFEYSGNA
jgi:hypothetical protein